MHLLLCWHIYKLCVRAFTVSFAYKRKRMNHCNCLTRRIYTVLFLSHQSGMMIAPVLANLGPIEKLTFKPNPGEVQIFIFTVKIFKM